jgi:hypothetical protein
MKEGSLFVLFVHRVEVSQTMASLVMILYNKYTSARRWFPNVSIYSGEIVESNILIEISFKSKLKFIEKFEHTLDIVGKPLMSKIK